MTEIATRKEDPLTLFKRQLNDNARTYGALLKAEQPELLRFMAEVVQACMANPNLLNAHRGSLLMAIGEAASMGLSINPNLGESYLIPRRRNLARRGEQDNWVDWVNFQRGYKGLVKLAYRSGLIDSIETEVVFKGEHYIRRGGTDNPGIEHYPDDTGDKRTGKFEDIVTAYAVFWIKGSARPIFRAVSRSEIERAYKASGDTKKGKHNEVYQAHPEAMLRKAAIVRGASLLPRSDKLREFHMAVERDSLFDAGESLPDMTVEVPDLAKLQATLVDPSAIEAMETVVEPEHPSP